ncbi:Uncharacterized protein dnl_55140 [Desulfonema limicola]|uniref:Uncharacterized protein n=1 Tax=Desulfonema limicola TaxID=45656 RepID=A0A975BD86_9BACT|nr:Uncharacterized protein dnl_55140 [Desulfonema limicola]
MFNILFLNIILFSAISINYEDIIKIKFLQVFFDTKNIITDIKVYYIVECPIFNSVFCL